MEKWKSLEFHLSLEKNICTKKQSSIQISPARLRNKATKQKCLGMLFWASTWHCFEWDLNDLVHLKVHSNLQVDKWTPWCPGHTTRWEWPWIQHRPQPAPEGQSRLACVAFQALTNHTFQVKLTGSCWGEVAWMWQEGRWPTRLWKPWEVNRFGIQTSHIAKRPFCCNCCLDGVHLAEWSRTSGSMGFMMAWRFGYSTICFGCVLHLSLVAISTWGLIHFQRKHGLMPIFPTVGDPFKEVAEEITQWLPGI